MAKSKRDEFSAKTKKDLAARAGHRCCFPGCDRPTSGPSAETPSASVNLGEAAHISGAASGPGSRRPDPGMKSAERSSIENGVWLCRTCHRLVDSDEATYTAEDLHRWKREGEARAEHGLRPVTAGEGKGQAQDGVFMAPRLSPYFTGRTAELKKLRDRLTVGGKAALSQAISGLGGVGKTQTAIAYCHSEDAESYRHVLWVNAVSEASLAEGYIDIAKKLKLNDGADPEAARQAVLQWLAAKEGWLLVLDNADEPSLLSGYLPNKQGGHVLVTTRAQRVPSFAPALPLKVMSEDEAVELLGNRLGRELTSSERETAKELAKDLGYLPLAIEQASAYLLGRRVSLDGYLKDFRSRRAARLEDRPEEGDYHATVATTWKLNFEEVERAPVPAGDVLRVSAFWAPDGIPKELLVQGGETLGPKLAEYMEGVDADRAEAAVGELLEPLRRFSLIEDDSSSFTFSVHRLLQDVIRNELEDEVSLWSQRAIEGLHTIFPQGAHHYQNWSMAYRYYPHVEASASFPLLDTEPVGSLLLSAGAFALAVGWLVKAREFQQNSLEILKRILGDEHPNTVTSMNNLASTLYAQGALAGARELQESSLEIRKRILGVEHPDTLSSMINLASTLNAQGDLSGARELQESSLEISQRILGDEHLDTLSSMINLASTLYAQGDLSGARELQENSLEIRKRILGEEHPSTLTSMINLALTLYALGDLSGARELQESSLEISQRILGDEHPDTVNSMNNLSLTLYAQGSLSGARELQENSLEIRKRILGEKHPSTVTSMSSLASTLKAQGDLAGARELQECSLKIRKRVLGDEHPSTVTSMNNLARTLKAQGDLDGARELQETAVAGALKVWGEDHPNTKTFQANLDGMSES